MVSGKPKMVKVEQCFTVKVQLPVVTNDPEAARSALVYDETRRRFNSLVPIDEHITRAMRGRYKAFFRAGFVGETFVLGTESEVPDPGW